MPQRSVLMAVQMPPSIQNIITSLPEPRITLRVNISRAIDEINPILAGALELVPFHRAAKFGGDLVRQLEELETESLTNVPCDVTVPAVLY